MKKILILSFICSLSFIPVTWSQDADINALIKELGIRESKIPSREMKGWERPKKITMMGRRLNDAGPGSIAWYEEVTDGIKIEIVDGSWEGDFEGVPQSDVFVGWCRDNLGEIEGLDYVHILSAGIERCANNDGLKSKGVIATNGQKGASETLAEHSIALMFALSRNLHKFHSAQMNNEWNRNAIGDSPMTALKGKTLLVLGLGGIGTQVAKRGYSLGMRVIGTRNSSRTGPDFIDYIGLSDETYKMAEEADFVVNALPITSGTSGLVNDEFFSRLKKGAYYVSVGRGKTTKTDALVKALKNGTLNGAGLDVTDPEPLPADHELWQMPNVIITPHTAARSDLSSRNSELIARENLRRYVRGEKLLNMVDLERGY